MKDYYSILGLTKTASSIDIRNAYKKLSLKYHPDRNINGTEKFKEISEAYQILYNSITRSQTLILIAFFSKRLLGICSNKPASDDL